MGILLGLILVTSCGVLYLLYEVIKQQGRLLLRLDGIEAHLALRAPAGAPVMPSGLAVGTPMASFRLPDLTGQMVALEDFPRSAGVAGALEPPVWLLRPHRSRPGGAAS